MDSYKKTICMVVQDPFVKGGVAAVVNGYRGSQLEEKFNIKYVEEYKDGNKLIKLFKAICGYSHFAKVLLIDKPDLIHIHSAFGPDFYRKLPFIYMADFANVPLINHIHGSELDEFYTNASKNKKDLIKKAYGKCDRIIALSDEWKNKLSIISPLERIVVIENYGITAENIVKTDFGNQILFLGVITKKKGCYDIPAVIEIVVKEIPDCKFVIAGDGDVREIKEILREKSVDANIVFPGWVRGTEKDKLLRESDIFFLPSYTEGMPMSVLDAMGYALPIISTNVGGIPKLVYESENGYLYEPGDTQGFARGIISLLKNKNMLKKFSQESLRIINEHYSLNYHLQQLSVLYRTLNKTE